MPNARIFQRILAGQRGEVEAALLMARIQERYDELKARRPIFDGAIFNTHVVGNILPGLAVYQILREEGLTTEAAMPASIQWGRTQTIGKGAEFCNFRWEYAPERVT